LKVRIGFKWLGIEINGMFLWIWSWAVDFDKRRQNSLAAERLWSSVTYKNTHQNQINNYVWHAVNIRIVIVVPTSKKLKYSQNPHFITARYRPAFGRVLGQLNLNRTPKSLVMLRMYIAASKIASSIKMDSTA
jgi:hypothetical protein